MFGVLFKLGLFRLCTVICVVIILPFCTEKDHVPYVFAILAICISCWLFCLDRVTSHLYVKKSFSYHIMRWLIVCHVFVYLIKMQAVYSFPDENTEMLTFVNLKNVYTCLSGEVYFFQKLISFILHALCRMFGALKPSLYIVYLILNAVTLLLVLEIIITRINLSLKNGILHDSNFRTYPVLEGIRNRKPLTDNITASYNDTLVGIEPCETGIFREDYVRYEGEDVEMYCGFYVFNTRNTRITKLNTYWIKNENIVITFHNDRIVEQTDIEVIKNMLWIKMHLSIKFLRPGEFGLYKCVLDYTRVLSELHAVPDYFVGNTLHYTLHLFETEFNSICYFGKHLISRAADLVEHIEIPVGNLAQIPKFFYITKTPVDEISFEYRVNGKDVHHICRSDYHSCTLSVILYKLLKYGKIESVVLQLYSLTTANLIASFVQVTLCVCGSFYGEHSLVMYIPYYNSTTKRKEIVEIVHEKKLVIEPVTLWWRPNSTRLEKILAEPNTDNSKMKEYITEAVCASQDLNFFVLNFASYCVAFAILWVLFRLFAYPWKLYCQLTVIPARNLILYGYLFNLPKRLNYRSDKLAEIEGPVAIQYDVFLSYSTEDYHWCKEELLPFLEEECRYKVCFPDRDLAHEGGKSKLALYTSATQACTKFIVVLSQSYIDDPDCNKLQLSSCILPLINGDNGNTRDLIFIKRTSGIYLPVQLKWNMDVHIVDWSENNSENDRKNQLKRFLTA